MSNNFNQMFGGANQGQFVNNTDNFPTIGGNQQQQQQPWGQQQ